MLCYWCIESLHYYFFSIISAPIIEVVVKEAYWTNIVESVQIFEHLNKLQSKSPFYEANEFQVLKPLLVAMVSDLGNHFCSFYLHFSILSMSLRRCGDQNWTAYSRWMGSDKRQLEWENEFCALVCSWSCGQWILLLWVGLPAVTCTVV